MSGQTAVCVFAALFIVDITVSMVTSSRTRLDTQTIPVSSEDILNLYRTLTALDTQLHDYQKHSCNSDSQLCDDVNDWLRNNDVTGAGLSGKSEDSDVTMLRNILEQRRAIDTLKRLVEAMKTGEAREEAPIRSTIGKRTCRLRLGGHCLTEALDNAATQYWYLKSPHSPGRKRRSTMH